MSNDVNINNNYPGVEYQPTETSGVYHEDRELTPTGSTISQLFRTYNAQYSKTSGQWGLFNTSIATAYATVQNPDGSTHYFTNPTGTTTWSSWSGSGNNTIYNAVDFGLAAGSGNAASNVTALKNAIAAAIADAGGAGATVFIPAGTWYLSGTITISNENAIGLVIKGKSGGTQLIQTASADMFQVSHWTGGTGVRFQDLYLTFNAGVGSGNFAVNVNTSSGNSGENITCERVYFNDCPGAFSTGPNSLQCGLLDCTIDYHNTLNNQIAVSITGEQNFVKGCVIRQPVSDSPSGCTGIQLLNAVTSFITDTHVSDFETGIAISGGTVDAFFSNLRIDAYKTAVTVAPGSTTATIYEVHFSNCTLALENGSTAQTSGVTIGTSGGANSNVAGIFFDNCSILGFANAGLEIDGGQNVVVTGGQYSSNGQNPGSTAYIGAGIAITDGTEITIVGADCSGISYLWQNQIDTGTFTTQPYGITIDNLSSHVAIVGCNVAGNATNGIVVAAAGALLPTNIFVRDCDASGYSSYSTAINVRPGVTSVEVTGCAGYNDQGSHAVLQSTIPPPSGTFSNVSFGYYGPIAFYVTGAGHVTIDGDDTNLTNGGYTLSPGETASIAGTATHFLAVGK